MEIPFDKKGQQLTVLSYGVGQDSTAILIKILHDEWFRNRYVKGQLIVITADTKNEHDHTYLYRDYIESICKEYDIPFFILDPKDYATGDWAHGLVGFYEKKTGVGSKAYPKTCSERLKIRPIYNFLEKYIHNTFRTQHYGRKKAFYEYEAQYGKIRVLLGIARGEDSRASDEDTGIKWFDQCIEKIYPLLDLGMNRQHCQDAIESYGYHIPMPSNCILCPFMSLQELLYLYRYERKWFDKLVTLESNKLEKYKHLGDKNLGVWGNGKTVLEMLKIAQEKFGHMTKEELIEYKMSHGHCVKSKF